MMTELDDLEKSMDRLEKTIRENEYRKAKNDSYNKASDVLWYVLSFLLILNIVVLVFSI